MFFGPIKKEDDNVEDVPLSMKIPMGILAALTVVLGIMPRLVVDNLLIPVVRAIYNLPIYIGSALGNVYGVLDINFDVSKIEFSTNGVYSPTNFLILFIILLLGVLLFVIFKGEKTGEEIHENLDKEFDMSIFTRYQNKASNGVNYSNVDIEPSCKYDIFVGGEEGEKVKVGANDLFWGMKYQLKGYLNSIQRAHSGSVNDYALWIVSTLVIVLIILFIFV